jgi:putative transposase
MPTCSIAHHSALPAPQAPQHHRPAPGRSGLHVGQADAGHLPQPDPLVAKAELEALARELDRSTRALGRCGKGWSRPWPSAGFAPPTLARTLRSTNATESTIAICRDHAANVKRWRDGQMVLRWVAAGMGEAAKQFRRVNGHLRLPALRAALVAAITPVAPTTEDAPPDHSGRH